MSQNPDVIALNELKDASLWFLIATLISAIGIFSTLGAIGSIIALIVLIVFGIPRLRSSFQKFLNTGKDVERGLRGITFLIWGLIILFIGGIFGVITAFSLGISLGLAIALGLVASALIILGVIILFLGELFIGLSLYNLGKFYNNELMKVGGIIEIVPPISFIGWILVYVSVDEIVRRLTGYVPQVQQGLIYQIGVGTMKTDGKATFTLYSSIQGVKIMSASIEGTTVIVHEEHISPNILAQGNNTINVNFPQIIGLIVGNNYNIILNLSNGQTVKVTVTVSQ
jgi:hypothetical protein